MGTATSGGWRTSSYSNANGGNCIEVGNVQDVIAVRDTKNHSDHTLPLSDYLLDLLIRRKTTAVNDYVFPGTGAGGYIVEQLSLWAPDKILRMQEDASALFSPDLYTRSLRPEDERQALAFPYSVIHLHSSSLFLLDRILRIEPLKCIQINKDAGDVKVSEMLPFLKRVQSRGKTLLVRGKLDQEDLKILRKDCLPGDSIFKS